MKYVSVDRLSDFEFHDAKLLLESFDDTHLTVTAEFLNIHKGTEQNPHETDMEITSARITFQKFQLASYEPGRTWKLDENGTPYSDEPQVVFTGEEAIARFIMQLKAGSTIFDFAIKEGSTYFMDAMAEDPFFTAFFTFERVLVEWDAYKKEAWYTEKH